MIVTLTIRSVGNNNLSVPSVQGFDDERLYNLMDKPDPQLLGNSFFVYLTPAGRTENYTVDETVAAIAAMTAGGTATGTTNETWLLDSDAAACVMLKNVTGTLQVLNKAGTAFTDAEFANVTLVDDTTAAYSLILTADCGGAMTADRALTINVHNADRVLSLNEDFTIGAGHAVLITAEDVDSSILLDEQTVAFVGESTATRLMSFVNSADAAATLTFGGTTLALTGGANTFSIAAGTASLDVAAGITLNIDADLSCTATCVLDQDLQQTANPTFGNLTITSFAADWTNAGRTIADLGAVTTLTTISDGTLTWTGATQTIGTGVVDIDFNASITDGTATWDFTTQVLAGFANLQSTGNVGTAGAGVTAVEYGDGMHHITVLTFTDLVVGTPNAGNNSAHGVEIYAFPVADVHLHSHSQFSIGLTVGTVTTDQPDVGLGSVVGAGANATLNGTTQEDYVTAITWATALDGTARIQDTVAATAGVFTGISNNATGDVKEVFLNAADGWAVGVTGNLTATGTVVLIWDSIA